MLEIKHLRKSYGDKNIIPDLSLSVGDGKIFGFIGHNGAGKTTTLKCVSGILPFEEGKIEINGIDVVDKPVEAKKIIAYLPDNPEIYEGMKCIQYLNFIADIFEVSKSDRDARISELARELEIYDNLGDPIKSFSHGMKQKAALISAFLHNPKLVILDEPFVGLDPKASFIMKKKLKEICESGSSVFFSSHVLEVVSNLCDEIAILKKGVVVKEGKTDDILASGESLEEIFLETEAL